VAAAGEAPEREPDDESRRPGRTQRGVVLPSGVVMLSVVAVLMAALAYVVTRDNPPEEKPVAETAGQEAPPSAQPSATPKADQPKPKPKPKPIQRGEVFVEVYNNSGITGLAGSVGEQAADAGWQVVGTDNWVGTIPANTVYFPPRLERAAKQLALDLGIDRLNPAVGSMKLDRLTVILTGQL
jgi:hypothetical protein